MEHQSQYWWYFCNIFGSQNGPKSTLQAIHNTRGAKKRHYSVLPASAKGGNCHSAWQLADLEPKKFCPLHYGHPCLLKLESMANNQSNQSESQADSLRKCWVPGPPRFPRLKSNKEQVRFSKLWLLVLLSKTEPARVCSTKRKMSERAEKQITSLMACGTPIMADVHFAFSWFTAYFTQFWGDRIPMNIPCYVIRNFWVVIYSIDCAETEKLRQKDRFLHSHWHLPCLMADVYFASYLIWSTFKYFMKRQNLGKHVLLCVLKFL